MTRKAKILIVEDEQAILQGLTDVFIYHGYEVDSAMDGQVGLDKAQVGSYDLIILDVMLPTLDGFRICNAIRSTDKTTPIVMLTAKSSEEDIINGLSLGADDYIPKPFSVRVLVLRIEAILRRTEKFASVGKELVLGGHISIDTENLVGTLANGQVVEFTKREIELLQFLRANGERPVAREELLVKVWGYAQSSRIETRTVDIHIAKIRRKLEPDPKDPRYLVTVRGRGYRLDHCHDTCPPAAGFGQ